MLQDYARTDRTCEIERKKIIDAICSGFRDSGHQKVIFGLYGDSGIGKSYVCKSIMQSNVIIPAYCKVLIDLNQIVNNNIPGIIQTIVATLGLGFFINTQINLDKYFKSIDASKPLYLQACIDSFIDELNTYAEQCGGILLVFDTFEALSANAEKLGFSRILQETNDKVDFLISGITKLELCNPTASYHLRGFDEEEILNFLISRNPKMKHIFKQQPVLLASQIRKYTDDGNPILCGLLSDWLLHSKDLHTQIEYVINTTASSRKHLINWIRDLDDDLFTALKLSAYFSDRMNPDFLSAMSGLNSIEASQCIHEMAKFSFVKVFSEVYDPKPQIILHDVVAELIRTYFPLPPDQLRDLTRSAVLVYDQLISDDRANSDAFKLEQSLKVEKLMCLVRNMPFDHAFGMLDNEILDGIDIFDYSFISQIINTVENHLKCVSKKNNQETVVSDILKWEFTVKLAKAEDALSRYSVDEAIEIYEELSQSSLYNTSLFKALADDMFARALVNPCSVDCYKSTINAIKILNVSSNEISRSNLNRRMVKSFYWLGNAYVRNGQNDNAQVAYDYALSECQSDIQKVMILLDMSKMIRLQQDVQKALEPLKKCDIIMESLSKNKGKYYYYKANIYRDLDDIETAVFYYNKAFEELRNGDDNFTLCELNLDFAWFQYIRSDLSEVNIDEVYKYLTAGWNYAQKYHFYTEYSEYHHILYEILNYLGEYVEAYSHLDEALKFAYKYSNIYMMLDCLNHLAQRYYREKKYELIPKVIQEMERIENSGCKIRVFRGRAKLVQADIYYEEQKYECALRDFFDGFLIVALYGNSRTNVELFDDLYRGKEGGSTLSRKDKIINSLKRLPDADKIRKKLRNTWKRRVPNDVYRYFLDGLR